MEKFFYLFGLNLNVMKFVNGKVVSLSVVNYVMVIMVIVIFFVMIIFIGLMMEKYFLMFIEVSVNNDEVLNRMFINLFRWYILLLNI